jgi:hypothetical protein
LKESKLEMQLKKAIESSKGAIMREVKEGMPNVNEVVKSAEQTQKAPVNEVKAA